MNTRDMHVFWIEMGQASAMIVAGSVIACSDAARAQGPTAVIARPQIAYQDFDTAADMREHFGVFVQAEADVPGDHSDFLVSFVGGIDAGADRPAGVGKVSLQNTAPYWSATQGYAVARGRRPVGSTIRATFGSAGSTVLVHVDTNGTPDVNDDIHKIYLIEGGPLDIKSSNNSIARLSDRFEYVEIALNGDITKYYVPSIDNNGTPSQERKRLRRIIRIATEGGHEQIPWPQVGP